MSEWLSRDPCPFCDPDPDRVFLRTPEVIGIWDLYPVADGHALLVPTRHVATWFGTSRLERAALSDAIHQARDAILERHRPDGFTIGINDGPAGGQTVPHLHIHVIPRYLGDVDRPIGGVRNVIPGKGDYLRTQAEIETGSALVAGGEDPLLPHLLLEIDRAQSADIAVAFVLRSGVDRLFDPLQDLLHREGRIRLLTGDYLDVTDPQALRMLTDLEGDLELRVFEAGTTGFHPKSFIFRSRRGQGTAFVGSSNLTKTALETGVEWNYRVISARDAQGFRDVERAFDTLFQHPATRPLTSDWIDTYENRRRTISLDRKVVEIPADPVEPPPEPHEIQKEALKALKRTRADGNRAGLVVLATGLGKTWLSAFDSMDPAFDRVLFVAHREEILDQARRTYRRIRPKATLGHYTGTEKVPDAEILFASIQTLGKRRHLNNFAPDAFDYIVVDEFHHAAARTYRQLIDHFDPQFLLGLTATPDRTDGADLLTLCGENLVYRCDMLDGIRQDLLAPFHYFGVPDEVDYANIPWRNSRFEPEALTQAVATQARAQNALEQYDEKAGTRTLAFCCSKLHADFMRDFFKGAGKRAASVHSGEDSDPRSTSLEQLNNGDIDVLFAVDMFNEGVDLPNVDTVLMLRPTESAILWLQQFGRGLRKAEGKERLTVIDYIGNHRSFLVKPRTLLALGPGDGELRQALRAVAEGEAELPPGCEITYDLEAVQILESVLRPAKGTDAIKAFYEDFRQRHGERPTAAETFHAGYSPRSLRTEFGSWLRFVRSMGDLDPVGVSLLDGEPGSFLDALETTPMTRSFKMVTLLALLNQDAFPGSLGMDSLLPAYKRVLTRTPALTGGDGRLLEDDAELRRSMERNPIPAWTGGKGTGGRPYFTYGDDTLETVFGVPSESRSRYQELVREIVDWRLAEYLDRERNQPPTEGFRCNVSHASGRPILFLPDREKVSGIPWGWTPVEIDGEEHEANFVKVAVNVVRKSEEGRNELPGILRSWFGPDAGQPGTRHRVHLKPGAEGRWELEPEQRVKSDGAELWQRYTREQVPGLFGLEFAGPTLQQGFLVKDQHMILFVTLDKSDKAEEHKYGDRFLSPTEFEWQSQNRTTQMSKHGQAIRHHAEQGIAVHLFVRPKSKEQGKTSPFFYCGDLEFERWEGERPITVWWRLKEEVPKAYLDILRIPG